MGAQDLKEVLVKHETSFDELRGLLAVDAFNTLYQFLTIIRQPDGTPLMDSHGKITSHLSGLLYRTSSLLEKGVKPVFVFDGEPSPLKRATIAERVERKQEAEELLKKAREEGRTEDASILAQRTARLTKDMVVESKELLDAMGVPHVDAPSEGEAQCAVMAAKGLVSAAASQDFDALLFGTPVLVRNLTVAGKRKLPRRNIFVDVVPERYILEECVKTLGITREKMVWMAMLMGTDFNAGVFGIGPKKALKLVKEHGTLEAVAKAAKAETAEFEPVLRLFMEPPSCAVEKKELVFKEPDRERVVAMMCTEHDFDETRVRNAMARAFHEPDDEKQGTLRGWC